MTPRILIVLCTAFTGLALACGAGAGTTKQEESLLDAVNRTRAAHGLRPLQVDSALVGVARDGARRVLRTNTLSHGAFRARLAAYGARGRTFAENLAWASRDRARAGAIVGGWLASPGHRANLLRPGFRRVGIGVAQGTFGGRGGAVAAAATFAGG